MSARQTLFLLAKAALIVAAGSWVLWPALHGPWIWDDVVNIPENPVLRDPAGLWGIWFAPKSIDYYPVFTSINWIGWHLWGEHTTGYHVLNAALEVADALLLWRVLDRLGLRFGWVGGLLLAVHPMMVESGAWISELKNTLSLFFLLLSFHCYLGDGSWKLEAGAGPNRLQAPPDGLVPPSSFHLPAFIFFLAALLSKASVVMYPVVLLLVAGWRRGRIGLRDLKLAAPYFALSAILGVVALVLQSERAMAGAVIVVGGPASRVALAGLTAGFYIWNFLIPINLMPIYPRWEVAHPSAAQFLPWIGFALPAWLLWRRRWTGALVCLAVYLVNLVPVSGLFTVSYMRLTWAMDHLACIPILGVIAALVAGLDLWLGREGRSKAAVRSTWVLVAVVFAVLAVAGRGRAADFSGAERFWRVAVAGNPRATAAHYNLGLALAAEGRLEEASGQFAEAAALDPSSVEAETNLANALAQCGRPAEAIPHYERSLGLDPGNAYTHYNLALALRAEGREGEARAELLEAARLAAGSRHPAVAPSD